MTEIAAPQLPDDVRAALPTFLIIGAAKAGTTSLHRYLGEHPDISMSSNKEPMCFVPDDWTDQVGRYRELFESPAPVRGEASIAYSAFPYAPEVPDRVRAVVPGARMIYCVRDPIERMLSHYAQDHWSRFPVRPFEELMDDLEHPMNMPVWCSRYATQYERWAERFGDSRLLVIEQRELLHDRAGVLRRAFEFLGVDSDFVSSRWDEQHNLADEHRLPTRLARRLGDRSDRLGENRLLRPVLTREIPKPRLTDDQRRRVVALFRPEAERLREMTGVEIVGWNV